MNVFVMGYPGDVGGAGTELWHTLRIWRSAGLDVALIPTWNAQLKYLELTRSLGCVTHQVTPEKLETVPGLAGAIVVSFCNGPFLANAKRLHDMGCRLVWSNCMTWLFDAEKALYAAKRLMHAWHFQSEFQRDLLEPQLTPWGYTPAMGHLIRGAFDASDWRFSPAERSITEAFVVGRVARPDCDKWSSNTWRIYDRVNHPRRRALMLGCDEKTHKKMGKPPPWADCLSPGAIPVQTFFSQLHCMLPVNGGARENWPRAGLEAMAAGVPIVAQKLWGWQEMIRHGETGFLGDSDEEFAHWASVLAWDERRRQEIAAAARESLLTQLADPAIIWDGWNRLFKSLG